MALKSSLSKKRKYGPSSHSGKETPSRKSVTWSPKVPNRSKKSKTAPAPKTRSSSSISVSWKGREERKEEGSFSIEREQLYVKSRKTTKNTVVMTRDRSFQLLVNLPERRVTKLYCKKKTWVVSNSGKEEVFMNLKLGTFVWIHDQDKVRSPSEKGFDLSWLSGKTIFLANRKKQPSRMSRRERILSSNVRTRKKTGRKKTKR